MTKKAEKETNTKKTTAKKTTAKKYSLYELVKECDVKKPILMGQLSKAGLLNQYKEEKELYQIEPLPLTITKEEFEEIINQE